MLQPKYPQKELLPKFENHLAIPNSDFVFLAKLVDHLNYGDTLFFYSYRDKWLVIITADENEPVDAKSYSVGQFEAPIEFLNWFSQAIDDYISPSSQGGLHPGAMTSQDQNVGGEMMCIQRAMDAGNNQQGYIAVNRSRENRFMKSLGSYRPLEKCFAENFLYEGGLLNLIKDLGEKFERGKL